MIFLFPTFMRSRLKLLLFILWVCALGGAIYYFKKWEIPLADYPALLGENIEASGVWAPIVYIILYAIRPIIFFPASVLTIVSGILFGPIWGTIYTIIGSNVSASVAFGIGRYFGQGVVKTLNNKFVQKLNIKAEVNGFLTVLILRLVYVPFDMVNYGCGVSRIRYRDYAPATLIGMLGGTLTFVLIGGAAGSALGIEGGEDQMRQIFVNLGLSIFFFILGIWLSRYLSKRHQDLSTFKTNSADAK